MSRVKMNRPIQAPQAGSRALASGQASHWRPVPLRCADSPRPRCAPIACCASASASPLGSVRQTGTIAGVSAPAASARSGTTTAASSGVAAPGPMAPGAGAGVTTETRAEVTELTSESFQRFLKDAGDSVVLVDFYADW